MSNKVTTLLLVVAIVLVLGIGFQVARVPPAVSSLIRNRDDSPMDTHWISGGETIYVSCHPRPDETPVVWAKRCREEYDALRAVFPKDP